MISLQGTLSNYSAQTRLTMFESGPQHSSGSVVFVAGLTDGYNALPYLAKLSQALADHLGMSLIQVMLSSSHMGYGTSSLQDDVRELDTLFTFLREERAKTRLFIIGHSTGCQDAISYATYGHHRSAIHGIILQGPVSDREFMASSMDMYGKYLRLAQRMIDDGKGQELMVREVDAAPMTAYRFHSLASIGGDDDMFSSDLLLERMQSLFDKVQIPVLVVHSIQDEYIPDNVDKRSLISKLSTAFPTHANTVILPEADHAISDQGSQALFCEAVVQFLRQALERIEAAEKTQELSFQGMNL